jgi:GNAT superfamily N-acetyltransferase
LKIELRAATVADAPQIHRFITELAIYEKAEHEVKASASDIAASLFATDSPARAIMCEADGVAIGYAVYFMSYSTWLGRPGMYLEDLYITPEQRGSGAGKRLLRHLARIACDAGCGRLEWSVLDWNEPAIQFYRALGAEAQDEWVRYRIAGDALRRFADVQE